MCIVRTDFKTFTEESKWNGIQMEEISPYVHHGKGLCIASDSLWNDAKERGGIAVNIAYTNYGGTFMEKTLMKYISERFPEDIIMEDTSWDGMNAFVFGNIADKVWDGATGNSDIFNLFDDFEDYFITEESNLMQAESESIFKAYKEHGDLDGLTDAEQNIVKDTIRDFLDTYGRAETFGADYYSGDFIIYMEDNLPEDINAKLNLEECVL